MNKKVVVSKINAISAMRQNVVQTNVPYKVDGRSLRKIYCSEISDSVTTYVQKKEWVPSLNDYLFPPYVECEYVE